MKTTFIVEMDESQLDLTIAALKIAADQMNRASFFGIAGDFQRLAETLTIQRSIVQADDRIRIGNTPTCEDCDKPLDDCECES